MTTLEQRISRLGQYINEAQWRHQLVSTCCHGYESDDETTEDLSNFSSDGDSEVEQDSNGEGNFEYFTLKSNYLMCRIKLRRFTYLEEDNKGREYVGGPGGKEMERRKRWKGRGGEKRKERGREGKEWKERESKGMKRIG